MSRRELLAFLSGTDTEGYVPASGSIVGILKQMHDEMSAGLVDATKDKEDAIKAYEGLMTVKIKEVNALTALIEVEVKRVGERGVENAVAANDLEDTKASLAKDEKSSSWNWKRAAEQKPRNGKR